MRKVMRLDLTKPIGTYCNRDYSGSELVFTSFTLHENQLYKDCQERVDMQNEDVLSKFTALEIPTCMITAEVADIPLPGKVFYELPGQPEQDLMILPQMVSFS